MEAPAHVYEIYIRTTPERLWQALVDGEMTRQYYYGSTVHSDWQPGSPIEYRHADGIVPLRGEVLEVDAPRRLVTTFQACWSEEVRADPPSRVTWEIEPMGEICRLTLVHDEVAADSATAREAAGGWPLIISGLKTLLEVGEPMAVGSE